MAHYMNLRQIDANKGRQDGMLQKKRRRTAEPDENPAIRSRSRSRDRGETRRMKSSSDKENRPIAKEMGELNINSPTRQWSFTVDKLKSKEKRSMYMCEYMGPIMKNLWAFKDNTMVNDYFDRQPDIRAEMRTVLFTWLIEVQGKFETSDSVLWHTFQLIDRYLTLQPVKRAKLQLVGCAAFFIAAKYGEIYPPQPVELVTVSDGAFTARELLLMETAMLKKLDFLVTIPTMYTYLSRFINIATHQLKKPQRIKDRVKYLALYTMERYILDSHSLTQSHTGIAAVVMYTAINLTSNMWTDEMVRATGLTMSIREPGSPMHDVYHRIKRNILKFNSVEHKAVIVKYSSMDRGGVSKLRKKRPAQPR